MISYACLHALGDDCGSESHHQYWQGCDGIWRVGVDDHLKLVGDVEEMHHWESFQKKIA